MKKFFENKIPKKFLIFVIAALAAGLVLVPTAAYAAEYLSENDPIVTLSYLKDIFAPQLKEEIKSETAVPAPETSVGYEVVELSAGQTLTSGTGTVELILRPGSAATVISEHEQNGLSDITSALEEVGVNHALIIPRNDGRGIKITSDKAYVLVRGDYKID